MATPITNYGSTGSSQSLNQDPTQIDPVVLARAMQIIASQMAASQNPQQATCSITQATAQQSLSLPEGQYVGDTQNGVPHGRGTLTYHPGKERKKYEGEWKEGQFHGRGILKFSNDARYEGEWENGKLHGQGIQFLADGAKCEGGFLNGQKHGKGTVRLACGAVYKGELKDDEYHGQGTYTDSEGNNYTGEFKKGKTHGQGKYVKADGDYYSGTFVEGKLHGKGYRYSYGFMSDGIFRDGQLWTGTSKCPETGWEGVYKDGERQKNCYDYCSLQ